MPETTSAHTDSKIVQTEAVWAESRSNPSSIWDACTLLKALLFEDMRSSTYVIGESDAKNSLLVPRPEEKKNDFSRIIHRAAGRTRNTV